MCVFLSKVIGLSRPRAIGPVASGMPPRANRCACWMMRVCQTAKSWRESRYGKPTASVFFALTYTSQADGRRVVTGGEEGLVKVWNADTGQLLQTLEAHTAAVTAVAVSHDGARLITGGRDATVKLWDPLRGKEVLTLSGHAEEITSVSFSPDDTLVLTSSRDRLAVIWPALPWKSAPPSVALVKHSSASTQTTGN